MYFCNRGITSFRSRLNGITVIKQGVFGRRSKQKMEEMPIIGRAIIPFFITLLQGYERRAIKERQIIQREQKERMQTAKGF